MLHNKNVEQSSHMTILRLRVGGIINQDFPLFVLLYSLHRCHKR